MKLTRKLFGYVYKPVVRDPDALFALTITDPALDPGFTWTVEDAVLTLVNGTTEEIDLTEHTLTSLVAYINGSTAYDAVLQPGVDGTLGARALLDGTGTPATMSNGDHLYIYTNLAWAWLDTFASALTAAKKAILDMLDQMHLDFSDGEWSDFWRSLTIGGARGAGETDEQQNDRTIATITQVKSNNLALEQLVLDSTGLVVEVIDIDWFDGNESMFTFGGPLWQSWMVTNSATSRIYPAWVADAAVMESFGLIPLPSGAPAYGLPSHNNPLMAAMAVVFEQDADGADYDAVMAVIEKSRLGGTVALGYKPSSPMLTNTVGDNTNSFAAVCGPVGTDYARWNG